MVTMWVMGGTCVCKNHRPQRENKMEGPWSTSRIVSFAVLTVLVFQQDIVLSHYDPRPSWPPGPPATAGGLLGSASTGACGAKPEGGAPLGLQFCFFFPGLLSILGLRV